MKPLLLTLLICSLFIIAGGAMCNLSGVETPITSPSPVSALPMAIYHPNEWVGNNQATILTSTGFYFQSANCTVTKFDSLSFSFVWAVKYGDISCNTMTLCPNGTCILAGAEINGLLSLGVLSTSDGSILSSHNHATLTGGYNFIRVLNN